MDFLFPFIAILDPISLSLLAGGAAASAGATGIGIGLNVSAARKTKRLARRQRKLGLAQANQAVATEQYNARQLAGEQIATFGAAGVEGVGTSGKVAAESIFQSILAQERILTGAGLRNYDIRNKAQNVADGLRTKSITQGLGGLADLLGSVNQGVNGGKKE